MRSNNNVILMPKTKREAALDKLAIEAAKADPDLTPKYFEQAVDRGLYPTAESSSTETIEYSLFYGKVIRVRDELEPQEEMQI